MEWISPTLAFDDKHCDQVNREQVISRLRKQIFRLDSLLALERETVEKLNARLSLARKRVSQASEEADYLEASLDRSRNYTRGARKRARMFAEILEGIYLSLP